MFKYIFCSRPKVEDKRRQGRFPYEWPTLDIIVSWSQSFDQLMKSPAGQKFFADFLKSEYTDEYLLFWQSCEYMKKERHEERMQEMVNIIYWDFIAILAPNEVLLDPRVRHIVNTKMSRPNANTFDEAQSEIFIHMRRDLYPRFLASALYQKMLRGHGQFEDA